MDMILIVIGILISSAIIYFCSKNWQFAIKLLLFMIPLQGAIRKWVFPQAQEFFYFGLDIITLGVYLGFLLKGESNTTIQNTKWVSILKVVIFIFPIFCLLEMFNPALGSPIIGIFGLKHYIFYIPLIGIVPYMFDTKEELYEFLRKYVLIIIPLSILAIVQFYSPVNSPINTYVEGGEQIATLMGEHPRVVSTFSYIQGFSVFLFFSFSLMAVLFSVEKNIKWLMAYALIIILILITSLMTGSRSVVLSIILFILPYLIFSEKKPGFILKRLVPSFVMLIEIFVIFMVLVVVFPFPQTPVEKFYERVEGTSDSITSRIMGMLFGWIDYINDAGLFGYGLGATQNGNNMIREKFDLPSGEELPEHEGEPEQILLDLGLIGFLFWHGLKFLLLFLLFKTFMSLRTPFLKNLVLAALLVQMVHITGPVLYLHTFTPLFWFLSSFIFLAPYLEKSQNRNLNISKIKNEKNRYIF